MPAGFLTLIPSCRMAGHGVSMPSITVTSSGALSASLFSPSYSCIVVWRVGGASG
jgi:hypothetical protein